MTDPQLPDAHTNGAGAFIPPPPPPPENVGAKRQRRPSVRLGDIGDQTHDSVPNRRPKQWKAPARAPRGRSHETLDGEERDREREREGNLVSGWRVRDSKAKTKRVRSNWGFGDEVDEYEEEEEEGHGNSPIQSLENRVSKDFEGGPSDTDWNGGGGEERNGIRVWLNQLGLGRYAPVFEIHEVDDEVLPLLTLEDLKDMGINAVGSRRKMYCAIQKLSRGFS